MDLGKVEMLAKMEQVLHISDKERLTQWYGDYNIFEPKLDVTQEDIDRRIEELSKQIEHNTPIAVEVRETLSRKVTVENPKSIQEAINTVMERYYSEKIVLDAEDFQGVEFRPAEDMDFGMEM